MKRVREKAKKVIKTIAAYGSFLATSLCFGLSLPAPVYAAFGDNIDSVTLNPNFDPEDALGKIMGFVVWGVIVVGTATFIWGLHSLSQAISNDRPEARPKAVAELVGGLIGAGSMAILKFIGIV